MSANFNILTTMIAAAALTVPVAAGAQNSGRDATMNDASIPARFVNADQSANDAVTRLNVAFDDGEILDPSRAVVQRRILSQTKPTTKTKTTKGKRKIKKTWNIGVYR